MTILFVDRRGDGLRVRARRQSQPHARPAQPGADRRQLGRQHGGQGGPLRHRADRAVRQRDHRRLVRRGQLESRQPDAARRRHGDAQHRARRDRLRRRRLRALRHAHLRDPRGVHRRADGRADARVPRQEDRADGHEARDARGARARGGHPRDRGHRGGLPAGRLGGAQRGAARAVRDPLRRDLGGWATTARRSPGSRPPGPSTRSR